MDLLSSTEKLLFFPLFLNSLWGNTWTLCRCPVSQSYFCSLILASLDDSCLQHLVLCSLPNGGILCLFLLHLVIERILLGRAVSPLCPLPHVCLFSDSDQSGLLGIYPTGRIILPLFCARVLDRAGGSFFTLAAEKGVHFGVQVWLGGWCYCR